MNGAEIKGLKLAIPKKRREERCDTCYWVHHDAMRGLACHGAPPTAHVLQEQETPLVMNPLRPGEVIPGRMRLRPITVWPPVAPDDFCRHWDLRAGPAVSAIPRLGEPDLEPGAPLEEVQAVPSNGG